MRRYLIVANQTLGGAALSDVVASCLDRGQCTFHLVVPATRPKDHLVWTEGEAQAIAQERLATGISWLRSMGAEVSGEVGDERPMLAIRDAVSRQRFNEVIISTLPPGMSRWLKQDLPARAARRTGLPVIHVGEHAPVPAG